MAQKTSDEKYRTIFEYSAVSLWEEDISRVRSRLKELKARGGFNLRTHLAAHPEFLQEAVGLIEVTDVNLASLRLFEAERKEHLLGRLDAVPDGVSSAALRETILAIDEGTSDIEAESSALTLKGKRLSLIVRTHIPPADAAYPCMLVSLIDVTARKEAEERERRGASILRGILESATDSIFIKDASLRMVLCNRALSRAIGKEPEDIYGKTDVENGWSVDLVKGNPGKGIAGWEKDDLAALAGNTVRSTDEPTDFEDGVRYYDTVKVPLRDPGGAIIGIAGIGRDVTERKKAEAENQRLATLVDSVDDAIVGLDLNRRITVWNRGAESVYGWSAEEMIGAATSILIPPELEDEARDIRERLLRGEQVSHFETARLRKDGSRIIVSLTLSAIRDGEGRITGMASVARDITAQKAVQAQLNRAQRLEGLAILAGGIAHKFNNINTVVGSYLQLIRAETGLPARLSTYAEAAIEGVQKAVAITDRLMVLTETGGGSSDPVRLDDLARTLLRRHERRIEDEKVRLALDLRETPRVHGDESRLGFVFSSIMDNALDSLLDRPVRAVTVRAGTTRDAAYFEVEDSGCGISDEDLPRIFSPFFSRKGEWAPKGSPQERLKGAGLSLAICSMMVSEHGGRIEVQSRKGAGSTFRVILPFAERRA